MRKGAALASPLTVQLPERPFLTREVSAEPLVRAARDRLGQVRVEHGSDVAGSVAAEILADACRRDYVEQHRLKPAGESHPCPLRLLERKSSAHSGCLPPGCDHPELWIRDGKAVRFTFHPYGLGAPDLAGLVDWCREKGLDFEISADSWHFPHHTLLVEIATEEELAERGPR